MASLPILTIPFSALSCRRPPTPKPSSPYLSRLVKAPNYSISSLRQKQQFRFSAKRTPEDDDHSRLEPPSKGKADSEASKEVNKAEKKPADSKAPVEAEVESEPPSKGKADSEASKDVDKVEKKPADSKEESKDVNQAEKKQVDSKAPGEAEIGSEEISDKELGEKLLQRQPIQFLVDAFVKLPWPGQGEVTQQQLLIDWSRRLAPVQHPEEFREMCTYKDQHWIRAYYGQGSAKIFFEMDSTDQFMRRRMVIMSFAVNGLKLRELNCFPLEKFLELLSIDGETYVRDFQSLFSEMKRRANRINWGLY